MRTTPVAAEKFEKFFDISTERAPPAYREAVLQLAIQMWNAGYQMGVQAAGTASIKLLEGKGRPECAYAGQILLELERLAEHSLTGGT
jgi:hypothetical protein